MITKLDPVEIFFLRIVNGCSNVRSGKPTIEAVYSSLPISRAAGLEPGVIRNDSSAIEKGFDKYEVESPQKIVIDVAQAPIHHLTDLSYIASISCFLGKSSAGVHTL